MECVTPTKTYQEFVCRINNATESNIPLSRRCPPSGGVIVGHQSVHKRGLLKTGRYLNTREAEETLVYL